MANPKTGRCWPYYELAALSQLCTSSAKVLYVLSKHLFENSDRLRHTLGRLCLRFFALTEVGMYVGLLASSNDLFQIY